MKELKNVFKLNLESWSKQEFISVDDNDKEIYVVDKNTTLRLDCKFDIDSVLSSKDCFNISIIIKPILKLKKSKKIVNIDETKFQTKNFKLDWESFCANFKGYVDFYYEKSASAIRLLYFDFTIETFSGSIKTSCSKIQSPEYQTISTKTTTRNQSKIKKLKCESNFIPRNTTGGSILQMNLFNQEIFKKQMKTIEKKFNENENYEEFKEEVLHLNERNENILMNAAYFNKHLEEIYLLMDKLKISDRRSLVFQRTTANSNILHSVATRGSVEFLLKLQECFISWGLYKNDLKEMLDEKECHDETPLGMAKYQKDRRDMIKALEEFKSFVENLPEEDDYLKEKP